MTIDQLLITNYSGMFPCFFQSTAFFLFFKFSNAETFDDFIDESVACGDVRVQVLVFVIGDELFANLCRFSCSGNFLSAENVDSAFSTHNGDLSDREGEHAVCTEVLAVHGDVCATVSLAEDERHARHCCFGVCKEELCTVADNAVVFLLRARHVTRNVFERKDRNVEAVAEADKACCLIASVHVQRTGEVLRLVSDNANHVTVEADKADDNVLCKFRLDFEEGILVGEHRKRA